MLECQQQADFYNTPISTQYLSVCTRRISLSAFSVSSKFSSWSKNYGFFCLRTGFEEPYSTDFFAKSRSCTRSLNVLFLFLFAATNKRLTSIIAFHGWALCFSGYFLKKTRNSPHFLLPKTILVLCQKQSSLVASHSKKIFHITLKNSQVSLCKWQILANLLLL